MRINGARSAPVVVRRHVVVGDGVDEHGTPSIAVWSLDGVGSPLAGWVFERGRALRETAVARRLLAAAGSALLVKGTYEPAGVLDLLALTAGVVPSHGRRAVLDLRRLVADLDAQRERLGVVVPNWPAQVVPGGSVVDDVLAEAALLRRCVGAWQALEAERCAAQHSPLPRQWQALLDLGGQCRLGPATVPRRDR
jgi:hypothetical protein